MTTVRAFRVLRGVAAWLLPVCALPAQSATKVYDVQFLLAAATEPIPAFRLLPEGAPDPITVGSETKEAVGAIGISELTALLREVIGAGVLEGGAILEVGDNGILFATGDAATHDKLSAWIELCRQVFLEQITFELHVLPATILSGGRSVLSREEADALLRPVGPHPTFVSVTRIGQRTLLETNEAASMVMDYDVEVAQSAQIPDPKIRLLVAGQGCELVTTRFRDGKLGVRVASDQTTQDGPPRLFSVASRDARGKTEQGRIQLPKIHHVHHETSAMLGDGEALLFGLGDGSEAVYCLRLRRPTAIPMPSGSGWSWVTAGELVGPSPQAPHVRLVLRSSEDERPFLPARAEASSRVLDERALVDRLHTLLHLDDGTDSLRWLPGAVLQIRAADAQRKAAQELIALLSSGVRQLTVEVRYGRLGAADAAAIADGTMDAATLVGKLTGSYLTSCLLQDGFSVLTGIEQAYVKDYDVEIASDSSVPNAIIGQLFAGISLAGRLQPATRGQYRFELRVSFAELASEIESFDLHDERFSPVDLPKLRDIRCFAAPIVDANKWTLMHLAPLHGTADHFAVVARVRE
jgi:hypothetical protein